MSELFSNNYSNSTVIVGFVQSFKPVQSSLSEIQSTEGLVKIKHIYSIINAALVQVRPEKINTFMSKVSKIPYVEYCHKNYLITPSVYDERIHEFYKKNQSNIPFNLIRKTHNLQKNDSAGYGVKIALIDSGLSPHPYLPATSFLEAFYYRNAWPDFISATNYNEIYGIINREEQFLFSSSSISEQNDFIDYCGSNLNSLFDEICEKIFFEKAYDWSFRGRKIEENLPDLEIYPHILGAMRRISIESYNFVDENLNILDTYGHGTQMAGILVGRLPASHLVMANPSLSYTVSQYEIDVIGIVPMAELLVLKCYDNHNLEDSNVGNQIRAIEYAYKNNSDIIYSGLTLYDIDPFLSYSLGRAIDNIDIPIVCPAGNLASGKLALPAGFPGAISVTGLTVDMSLSKIVFSDKSNWASQNQKVTFSALSGDINNKILTTSLNFGFDQVNGTSVSAAITTGILALQMSNFLKYQMKDSYKTTMKNNCIQFVNPQPNLPKIIKSNLATIKADKKNNLVNTAILNTDKSVLISSGDDYKFGWGIIRAWS